ncbi:MAG TPA: zf-HC2 domain-containing protein [Patescibacteria group bacterium]|nr:zf-HC2 domain-containing protein [Patescibacteria group bacterium]
MTSRSMTCHEFERQLDEIVGKTAPVETLRDAARHVATCTQCEELAEIARASLGGIVTVDGVDTAGMVNRILSLTSGPACGAAGERLADLVDGALTATERSLVIGHLGGCEACADLAATMSWMSEPLASLCEIDPGESFTAGVMRATAPPAIAIPAPGRLDALRPRFDNLGRWWAGVMARPRFTWEAAYVGGLVVWLLFGAAFSPFHAVPERALELARLNPVSALGDTVQPASFGEQVWQATGERMLQKAETSTERLSQRTRGLQEATGSLARDGAGMLGSAFRGDLSGSAVRLKDMGADLQAIWNELKRRDPKKIPNAKET